MDVATSIKTRVPVTLLTGFLGSGKTSRLNATLNAGDARIAVIENEIGALSVDGALVANRHDDGFIELTNGCICCSGEVDLIGALEALVRRWGDRPFDRVIIETTGLADVSPVISLLQDQDDELAESYRFDGVITVVDAASFKRWSTDGSCIADSSNDAPVMVAWASGFGGASMAGEADSTFRAVGVGRESALKVFWRQVSLADTLIVSKSDLVEASVVEDVCGSLSLMNPVAEIVIEPSGLASPLPPPRQGHRHTRTSNESSHKSLVTSICGATLPKRRRGGAHLVGVDALTFPFPSGKPLSEQLLSDLLKHLFSGEGNCTDSSALGEAWRVKGLVLVEGIGVTLVQGVGDQLSLEQWQHGLDGPLCLVVIGENLAAGKIDAALKACHSSAEQSALEDAHRLIQ
eukprot:TRINITY_DN28831_c0_g3_i1.p1 TRINITY_DN28831_c0_g3~~TRINITY_DN28831_c0_g3_i1.p1  ORF type:complete len:405 (+),score=38.98 TRINITY_DN28831_c0_g3_i1:187-1401(+)